MVSLSQSCDEFSSLVSVIMSMEALAGPFFRPECGAVEGGKGGGRQGRKRNVCEWFGGECHIRLQHHYGEWKS